MKINTLVIGLGKVGMGYDYNYRSEKIRSHSQAVFYNKNFKLVGGVDKSFDKRKKFKKKFKTNTYKDLKVAIDQTKPKLVIISSPIATHLKILELISKKNFIKIILCEKPITNKFDDTRKILKKISNQKKYFFTNYIRQSDPIIDKIIRNNKKIIFNPHTKIEAKYYDGIYNNCSHLISFFIKLFGKPNLIKNIKYKKKEKIKINSSINFDLMFQNRIKVSFISVLKKLKKIKYEIVFKLKEEEIKFSFRSTKIYVKKSNKTKHTFKTEMDLSQKNVLKDIYFHVIKKKFFPIKIKDILITEEILDKIV